MIAATQKIAESMAMSGWLEVEFVVDTLGVPWVLEVNPRICGTMRLAAMCTDLPIFDLPDLNIDGPIAAVRVGGEVPWAGERFADPDRRLFATTRLTAAADDLDALDAKFSEFGVRLAGFDRADSALRLAAELEGLLEDRPLLQPLGTGLAVLFDRVLGPSREQGAGNHVYLSSDWYQILSRSGTLADFLGQVHVGEPADLLRAAVLAVSSMGEGLDPARHFVVLDSSVSGDAAASASGTLGGAPGASALTVLVPGSEESERQWSNFGWRPIALHSGSLEETEAALMALPSGALPALLVFRSPGSRDVSRDPSCSW
jgi:hypothetical protein